jgi:hypothetical protein
MPDPYQFNVYTLKWRLVDRFWSGVDRGLSLGGFVRCDRSYSKPVYVKRVA